MEVKPFFLVWVDKENRSNSIEMNEKFVNKSMELFYFTKNENKQV
jgi:hypothetical protein